ncbi:putative Protoporphyrin IX magnesium-chelatase [Frankia canadensis]|uniref:Putative Protoporphyrin IX magnesium-chelatase n=1 Tax=Frankia canadensis TaxID=1836972 RepID=A0A2I2L1V5_9ACTN|nr:hypothetical protein [Frankia canadensis]SNQ51847.1 putative Protoporphyrin IX magnesium-chelatase [Frankia canadensis]SOU59137.1 putative Protoporphyrin IX magnesium-chelatase [Frankia canadensis]
MAERGSARLDALVECMALHPELRGLLLLDAEPDGGEERLALVIRRLAGALKAVTGRPVREIRLGAGTSDDDLWAGLRLRPDPAGRGVLLEHVPRPLLEQPVAGAPIAPIPLVAVADLTIVSVPAARAIVTIAAAPVAAMERDGFSCRWEPTGAWVAVCDPTRIGSVSPHLLDRFPLRAPIASLVASASASVSVAGSDASSEVPSTAAADADPGAAPTPGDAERAEEGRRWPAITRSLLVELAQRSPSGPEGHRRPVALARLAVACARRRGADQVEWEDAATAFGLLGVPWSHAGTDAAEDPGDAQGASVSGRVTEPTATSTSGQSGQSGLATPSEHAPTAPDATLVRDESGLGLPVEHGGPAELTHQVLLPTDQREAAALAAVYPEDDSEPLREAEPLRLLWAASHNLRQLRGQIVGTRAATDLRDIAVVPSLLRAAARRAARRPRSLAPDGPLLIDRGDLRAYRRMPVPEQILVLLLDHTARPGASWVPVLSGYLEWAYVQRARMAVIEVGVADGPGAVPQLHAERFLARGILDPRISSALAAPAGTASPLAHGLDLAHLTVLHALRHGNTLVREAYLVIATDGRGNVPLADSRLGELRPAVGDAGVRDALEAASRLRGLRRLVVHVVDLGGPPYADLPRRLASASGAAPPATPRP